MPPRRLVPSTRRPVADKDLVPGEIYDVFYIFGKMPGMDPVQFIGRGKYVSEKGRVFTFNEFIDPSGHPDPRGIRRTEFYPLEFRPHSASKSIPKTSKRTVGSRRRTRKSRK